MSDYDVYIDSAPVDIEVTGAQGPSLGGGGGDVGDLTTTGLTAGNLLRVAAAGGLEQRTPAQVRSDIGAAATLGSDDNYVTDAEKVKLSNLSGTNTGDQNLSGYLTTSTAASTYAPISHNHAGQNLTPASLSSAGGVAGADTISGFSWVIQGSSVLTGLVIYVPPNASGTLALTADATGVPDAMKIGLITESTTARTLSASDIHKKIRYTNASGCAITIPNGIGVAGTYIIGRRATGAGALSFTLGGSVTVNNSGIASIAAGQEFALMALSANEYDFISDTVADAPIFGQLAADYTLTSTTAAQKLFDFSANGAVQLPTGRYSFSMMVQITGMSATSGNATFSLLGAGTATIASVIYHSFGIDTTNPLAAGNRNGSASDTSTATTTLVAGSTGTALFAEINGFFNITATGTIIPSIALTTAAAAVVKANSYFMCERKGPTGSNTQGDWS